MNILRKIKFTNALGDIDPTSFGYDYAIRTTSLIRKKAIEQKFYDLESIGNRKVSDYVPIAVGEGMWEEEIVTNLSYDISGDFEDGFVGTASGTNQIPSVDVGIAPVKTSLQVWMKGYKYSIVELEKATQRDKWGDIQLKTNALYRNWKLGMQRIAFLGAKSDNARFPGLLTNSEVKVELDTIITKPISSMDATEFQNFVATLIGKYSETCLDTVYPNVFLMPKNDYEGMAAAASPNYPIGPSKLKYLKDAFVEITDHTDFQILPIAYANPTRSLGFLTYPRYVLYVNHNESLSQFIPVDFQWKGVNTAQNIMFEGAAVGQLSGLENFRIREMVYFDYTP